MRKKRAGSTYDRYGCPAGPPTLVEVHMRGVEAVWLRWAFRFGCDPMQRECHIFRGRYWSISFSALPEVGLCMVLPRKSVGAGTRSTSSSVALDAGPLTRFSELWAFLTAVAYPDGGKRKTGRLSFSFDAGALSLSLNDPETNQYCVLTGTSLTSLLEDAELKMAADELAWRKSKYGK